MRRQTPENTEGFLLSPNGFLRMGALEIYPDGRVFTGGKILVNSEGKIPQSRIDYGDMGEVALPTLEPPMNAYSEYVFDY